MESKIRKNTDNSRIFLSLAGQRVVDGLRYVDGDKQLTEDKVYVFLTICCHYLLLVRLIIHTDMEQNEANQATDTATQLQDELIQAAVTERRLLQQLDEMKDDINRLQTQHINVQKDFDDFKRRVAYLWQQQTNDPESMFLYSSLHCTRQYNLYKFYGLSLLYSCARLH